MTALPLAHLAPLATGESARACFGVGCPHHHRCARYEAVASSETSSETLGTCLSGNAYPLFAEVRARN